MAKKDRLQRTLEARPAVRFSFLFGSRASGGARPGSDWDVAVYLDDGLTARERFAVRTALAAELADGADADVDVVVLNDADPLLAHRALSGELLEAKDRRTLVRYFVRTMSLVEDRRYFDRILFAGMERRLAEGTYGRP